MSFVKKIIIALIIIYLKKKYFVRSKNIKFYVINLNCEESKMRMEKLKSNLIDVGADFERVEGINLKNYDIRDTKLDNILKPIPELLGQKFKCVSANEEWIYDGTIHKSFPCLPLNSNWGTKGLTLSNMKVFDAIINKKENYDYYCILEDDAKITQEVYDSILKYINKKNSDIYLLDYRYNGEGGCVGVIYNKRIIKKLRKDLHPCSQFSIENEEKHVHKLGCNQNLWDWKLVSYIKSFKIKTERYPIIRTQGNISTIGTLRIEKYW